MQSSDTVQKRIDWVDITKGYGMLLVILGHIMQGQIERWIYSFHVPLFFMMSGFVFSRKENFWLFLRRKCQTLLLPYFTMGAVVIAFQSVNNYLTDPQSFTYLVVLHKIADLFIQIRCWDLWFLACLFWLEILFYVVVFLGEKFGGKWRLWVIGALSLLITAAGFWYYRSGGKGLPWNVDVSFVAVFFFAAGYLFRKTNAERVFLIQIDKIPTRTVIFLIVMTANVACWSLSHQRSGQYLDMYMGSFGIVPLTYIAAICGTVAIMILSKWFSVKPIQYIGKNSLVYYCWHQSIMIPIAEGLMGLFGVYPDSDTGRFENVFCMIILFVLVLAGMSLINYAVSKTKFRYLIGHWD